MTSAPPDRGRGEEEAGFSLVELLVAMFIFAIFGTIVFNMSGSFLMTSMRDTQRMTNIGAAQTVMDRLTGEIRAAVSCACGAQSASPVASADANDVTFYASLGSPNGPTKVVFSLTGTTLTETDYQATGGTNPNWTFSSSPQTVLVSSHIVNTSTNPIFTYYLQNGNQITSPSQLTPGTTPSSDLIESVGINLDVQQSVAGSAVSLDDRVHLLNVDYAGGTS